MYKQCRTEQSASRQRQLEQGLLHAMDKQRYDEISVSELCDQMEIPRKSFYRYFDSKDGALLALIDHALMDFDTFSSIDYAAEMQEDAQKYMERVFGYWVANKNLLDALEKNNLSGILIQRAVEYTKQLDTIPPFLRSSDRQLRDYATMFAVCGLMSMLVQWHHDGFTQSVEQMAYLAIRLLTEPIFIPEK